MTNNEDHNSYRVEVNGTSYKVTFLDDGRVRFEDKTVTADITENESRDHFSVILNQESFLLGVEPSGEPNRFKVHAGGYDFDIDVLASREAYLQEYLKAAGVGKKEGKVKATMPGLIRQVEVKEGDTVAAGDGVLIMEAMKMENEIKTPVSGVVTKVGVSEGEAVEKGAFLFEVEAN